MNTLTQILVTNGVNLDEIPEEFIDPISFEIMMNPVCRAYIVKDNSDDSMGCFYLFSTIIGGCFGPSAEALTTRTHAGHEKGYEYRFFDRSTLAELDKRDPMRRSPISRNDLILERNASALKKKITEYVASSYNKMTNIQQSVKCHNK